MLQLQPSTALPMATSRFGSFPPGGRTGVIRTPSQLRA